MKQITFNGNKNIIGKRLSYFRKLNGLSQSELAAKMQVMNINIDQQMISKIEKNQRQVTDYELFGFCKCLKVSADIMFKGFNNY